jgi:hypothetical protein
VLSLFSHLHHDIICTFFFTNFLLCCSSCPHGRCFTVLAQCFAVGSWITSVLSVTSCFYVFVRPIPEEGEPELPREGFGYISRQVGVQEPPAYRQCAWYERSEKEDFFAGDGMWNAGKAMSLLAVGIGFVAMCITLCTCCVAFELPTFDGLFWTCLLCFIAQSLTFLSWGSDLCDEYECTWSSGTGMNITAAMMWIWAANMVKSFPEALPPRGSRRNNNNNNGKQRRQRRPQDGDDDDDGAEDSPYLNKNNNNNNTPFQDEYNDDEEDEFNDWNNDDGNHHNRTADHDPQGYYDENGDWHEPEEPQGYYDDDGNWYQYDNDNDNDKEQEGGLDGAAESSSSYNGSYYGQEGEDPLQPSRRYNSDDDNDGYEEHGYGDNNNNADDDHSGGLYDAYDYGDAGSPSPSSLQAGMSQEEMEFMRASQRTMNSMN